MAGNGPAQGASTGLGSSSSSISWSIIGDGGLVIDRIGRKGFLIVIGFFNDRVSLRGERELAVISVLLSVHPRKSVGQGS
jgi:hypothetical protein